ncbi:hypothetical protein Mal35_00780 [Gimesia maris]|uniref:hypothetical protein n=1 Tax=Gimesia maris TaxID=122 RepID=UPI001189A7E5|nr:hypothetical protein [Gimesia maris]QDT76659.1 hypothetical protein Mal35_00780 [Gimesia maris]
MAAPTPEEWKKRSVQERVDAYNRACASNSRRAYDDVDFDNADSADLHSTQMEAEDRERRGRPDPKSFGLD